MNRSRSINPIHRLLPALIILGALPASAQMNYREDYHIAQARRILPSTGAAAAYFNPAAMSEAHWGRATGGFYQAVSGKGGYEVQYASASLPPEYFPGLPFGLSMGFGRSATTSRIDNSNAIFRENMFSPGMAVSTSRGERPWMAAVGLAMPIYEYNAFGAVRNHYTAMDAGLLGSLKTVRGEFRGTLAYHNLLEPKVELPDNRGDYAIEGWMEISAGWTSPDNLVRLYWEQYLREKPPASEGPDKDSRFGVNAWEIELRPISWAGIKLEKVRIGELSCLGLVINPKFGKNGKADFLLEANISHDKLKLPELLFGESVDEGRGAIYALALGVGI